MDEIETMPLTWRERLLPLKVGEFEEIQGESSQGAYTAIRVHFTESEDPELNTRTFTIRRGKVWRLT